MKGDFSRARLDPNENHTRSLQQQGRPLIDSAWNEQVQILLENQRTIFGPQQHGYLPPDSTSFRIDKTTEGDMLKVSLGTYVFDGRVIRSTEELFTTAFVELSDSRFVAKLKRRDTNGVLPSLDATRKIPDGNFVVAIAALERELFYEEGTQLDPRLADLRASVHTKMDWYLVLERPDEDASFDNKRGELLRLTDCAFSDPPPLCVNIPASTYRSQYNRLYRIEVHEINLREPNAPQMTLKLTVDNAAYPLQIARGGISGSQITINTQGVDTTRMPAEDDWVEVESLLEPDWLYDRPAGLFEVAQPPDGDRIVVQGGSPRPLEQSQLTRWQHVADKEKVDPATIAAKSTVKAFESLLKMRFRTLDDVKKLKRGDSWEILIRTAEKEQDFLVYGTRQSPYFAPLADRHQNGTVVDKRQQLKRWGDNTPLQSCPLPPAPVAPADGDGARINKELLEGLACRTVFKSLQTNAVNRWIASVNFDEIADLSRTELQDRIKRDCAPDQYDDQSLDEDLDQLVLTRNRLLAGSPTTV